ncbi:class I SAM-dependent methyltransferase [Bacillus fonticola]|uniref:class I SAM-dependent methyltransferase n=1 Tax=Bacillus fonticola TaxID=2728853 RepID=UPI0014752F0F|nr:class I SAM-dependent methyltransferase [Bacillus fonticola]
MSQHYFERNPASSHKREQWSSTLRGHTFRFITDSGVFSKGEVDFGTRVLLSRINVAQLSDGGPLLDVGCGYGPIGLALARELPDRIVHMVDVNERALCLAKENAELNSVSNVQIYESDAGSRVTERGFELVVTNPPIRAGKEVVHRIYEDAHQLLSPKGTLWVVIQKKQGAPSTLKKLEQLFSSVDTVHKEKGYYIICAWK